jgi:hypothetical protein
MMNTEEIFKCLSSKKESDLIFAKHFIDRYHERINEVPNIKVIANMLLTCSPNFSEPEEEDKYKLYYNLTEESDLIIIIVLAKNPRLLTLYSQPTYRRSQKCQ